MNEPAPQYTSTQQAANRRTDDAQNAAELRGAGLFGIGLLVALVVVMVHDHRTRR